MHLLVSRCKAALAELCRNALSPQVPLLAAICNPGLRDRHWEAIADVAGFEIRKDEVSAALERPSRA